MVWQSRLLNQEGTFGLKHELSDLQQIHARSCKYDLKLSVESATRFSRRRLSLFVPFGFTILFNAGSRSIFNKIGRQCPIQIWDLRSLSSQPPDSCCVSSRARREYIFRWNMAKIAGSCNFQCFLIHGVRFSGLHPRVVADCCQFTANFQGLVVMVRDHKCTAMIASPTRMFCWFRIAMADDT